MEHCSELRIQDSFSTKPKLLHPVKKLLDGLNCWKQLNRFWSIPKLFGTLKYGRHRQRFFAAALVCRDMSKLSQYQRS